MHREMKTSIVISTKNRKSDLRRALKSCLLQEGNIEILVIDDGSEDATCEMVRDEFPSVRLFRSECSRGYIVQRNLGAKLAEGEIIFSLDDDAEFVSPNSVKDTLCEFSHPLVGAVAMPWVNVNESSTINQIAPERDGIYVTRHFTGLGHAVRRDLFLMLGGYKEYMHHNSEETEFCLRLLNAGYFVRLGNGVPVKHHESPYRNLKKQYFFAARNSVLIAWYNTPAVYLPVHLLGTVIHVTAYGLKHGNLGTRLKGLTAGITGCAFQIKERRPVDATLYRLWRFMTRVETVDLEDLGPEIFQKMVAKAGSDGRN
jgi:glycosyltransferase involved in cell wall biosynthesis